MASELSQTKSDRFVSTSSRADDRNTYLRRCTDALEHSESIATEKDRYALAYKVGAIALTIFFSTAALTSAVLIAIYLPVFLPMTGVICALSIPKVRGWIEKVLMRAASYELTTERIRAIAHEYRLYGEERTPLQAHLNYWNRMHAKYDKEQAGKLVEAEKPSNADSRIKLCMEASRLRQKALVAKTWQAFTLAVMRNPDFEGKPEDIYTLKDFSIPADLNKTDMPWVQNAVFGIADRIAPAVVFKVKTVESITLDELQTRSAEELSTRFLKAMG